MTSPRQDSYKLRFLGAVLACVAAAAATFVPGDLIPWVSALITLLAGLGGWALGDVITGPKRYISAVVAAVTFVAAYALTVVGERTPCAPDGVTCLVGGCDSYTVYAQNRFEPLGARIVAAPQRRARKIGSFDANELVTVDGWVRTQPAYPHNTAPFDSDYWFHLADDRGWVAYAAVRADPTEPAADPHDPQAGPPSPAPEQCHGTFAPSD